VAHDIALVLSLLVAVAALVTLSGRLQLPYPIFLVLAGLVVGVIPGLPRVELEPDLVFLLFLPPLLYQQALTTSYRDFRADLRPISLLAVGLVLITIVTVAGVAHAAAALPWPAAFALGAIIAPTDALAASGVASRLGIPRRIVTVLEGESLLNDATSLVAYRFAVAAVVTGAFSLGSAALGFVAVSAGGVIVGLVVGWLIGELRRRLDDPPVENLISLLSGFAAYLPAEALGVSGVLAVVTAGFYLGRLGPRIISSRARVQNLAMWGVVTLVLNGLLFILVGLQLPPVLDGIADRSLASLLRSAILVSLTVILVRLVWVYPSAYVPRRLSPRLRARDPYPPWQYLTVLGWGGMRGAVSLAAALALPRVTDAGAPFPGRALIIFLTFAVLLATLVGQGLTLPPLIRRLDLHVDPAVAREEAKARLKAAHAAMARLEALVVEDWVDPEEAADVRSHYEERFRRYAARFDGATDGGQEARAERATRLRRELLDAERTAIIRLRDENYISDDVLRRVQLDLDLDRIRLDS